ncbi:hypothetical protein PFISCL1PPCAC_322 [Pristionchus fissidentatus]|uniref:Aftiphilin clathrin-binding box domain-containing protein n=1 Tax=Pristionchus fissidentatus TaxID=1538716 RepID=A0AAV5US01_9BILA|nr:hypothetical protein PFISCL1PPCAC_322 [Pristionchus fissidentatus]
MDEGPPPFVPTPDAEEASAPFDASFSSVDGADLDSIKLPFISRSPSPSPLPKVNGVHQDEKENDSDLPPPFKLETFSDSSLPTSVGGGGIESFLEREAIKKSDLPVDCIGLSPAASRDPSPCPERREKSEEEDKKTEEILVENGVNHTEEMEPIEFEAPPTEIDQSAIQPDQSIEEEEDDFGDFGFAPPPPPPQVVAKKDLSTVTEEEYDWAGFQSSSVANERKQSFAVDDDEEEDDDWAAFESAAPTSERQPSLDDGDDWATDFASAPPPAAEVAAAAAAPEVEIPNLPSLAELSIDDGIWSAESAADEEKDGFAYDLYTRLDADDPLSMGGEKAEEEERELLVSASLWLALRVVEEAAALRHTWEGSRSARHLYDLLAINTSRPMQRAALAAASVLSPDAAVLQPTKIGEMNGKSARTVTFSSAGNSSISHVSGTTSSGSTTSAASSSAASTSLSSGCLVPSSGNNSRPISPAARSPAAADPQQQQQQYIAPPVEFDWEKSNLKTPSMQQISSTTMLDMDYLAGGSGGPPKIISSDSTLQRDLDAFGLSATSASAGMPRVESTPSVLDTILSSARSPQAPRYLAPAELSLDARALHDALPSLDYLAASWIAFPVRDNGDN